VDDLIATMAILLRFLLCGLLAGAAAVWGGMSDLAGLIFVIAVGIVSAIWGDKFLLGFMSLMRYLR